MNAVSLAGYIVGIGGAILMLLSRQPKQTIENYKDLVESQEKRLKVLEDQKIEDQRQHIENVKAIADLQGQVKVYKELPLQKMADAMETISKTSETNTETNGKILEILQSSAITLAHDTADAAKAVKNVKNDLKSKSR